MFPLSAMSLVKKGDFPKYMNSLFLGPLVPEYAFLEY